MIERQRQRVEKAVSDMIDDMYRSHLREMQYKMHLCAATCCQNKRGTLESVQNCIDDCTSPLLKAQDLLAKELGQFQGHLQTCVMKCNEDARYQMSSLSTESEVRHHQKKFEKCTVQCVDQHIALIPTLMKTIKSVLSKGRENLQNV